MALSLLISEFVGGEEKYKLNANPNIKSAFEIWKVIFNLSPQGI